MKEPPTHPQNDNQQVADRYFNWIYFYNFQSMFQIFIWTILEKALPAIFLSLIFRHKASALRLGQFSNFWEKLLKNLYSRMVMDIRLCIFVNFLKPFHFRIQNVISTSNKLLFRNKKSFRKIKIKLKFNRQPHYSNPSIELIKSMWKGSEWEMSYKCMG